WNWLGKRQQIIYLVVDVVVWDNCWNNVWVNGVDNWNSDLSVTKVVIIGWVSADDHDDHGKEEGEDLVSEIFIPLRTFLTDMIINLFFTLSWFYIEMRISNRANGIMSVLFSLESLLGCLLLHDDSIGLLTSDFKLWFGSDWNLSSPPSPSLPTTQSSYTLHVL
ncbi:hypothetical protein BLOT_014099, partial [Blomia tropicalis]